MVVEGPSCNYSDKKRIYYFKSIAKYCCQNYDLKYSDNLVRYFRKG